MDWPLVIFYCAIVEDESVVTRMVTLICVQAVKCFGVLGQVTKMPKKLSKILCVV